MSENFKHYDWSKTFSYNAFITIVIGAKNYGKTFGIRCQFIRDYIKSNGRDKFVDISRYSSSIPDVACSYFTAIEENISEFSNYMFKVEKNVAYISIKQDEPEWGILGYFVALTDLEKIKRRTWNNIRRVCFDEFMLERSMNEYARYLKNENNLLIQVLAALDRRKDGDKSSMHVYLLGNKCDLTNPHLYALGIRSEPKVGYSWYRNKLVLLHNVVDVEYSNEMRQTNLGKLAAMQEGNEYMFGDGYIGADEYKCEKKTSNARFIFGIKFSQFKFGVWFDDVTSIWYINEQFPKANINLQNTPIYVLTHEDNTIDVVAARRSTPLLKKLVDLYYSDRLRYSSPACRNIFMDTLSLLGVR